MTGGATKVRLSLFFDEETMFEAVTVFKRRIERQGMPEPV
jgi:hypothetical protein